MEEPTIQVETFLGTKKILTSHIVKVEPLTKITLGILDKEGNPVTFLSTDICEHVMNRIKVAKQR